MKTYEKPEMVIRSWEEYLTSEGMPDELPQERGVDLAKVYIDDKGNEVSELDLVADKINFEEEVFKKIKRSYKLSYEVLNFVKFKYEKKIISKIPEMEF